MAGKRKSPASPRASRPVVPRSPRRSRGTTRPTARNLLSLPPGEFTDGSVRGLVLRVRPTARHWMLRYTAKRGAGRGPQRRLTLGMVGGPPALDFDALGLGDYKVPMSLGLAEARDLARALLGLAASGRDPLELLQNADRERQEREAEEARRREAGTTTVGALLERFIAYRADPPADAHMKRARPNTLANWRSLLSGALAPLRDRDPEALTAKDVRAWHKATGAGRGRTAANRALELLTTCYRWAVEEELVPSTPCIGIRAFPETPRSRTLNSDEIRAVWQALDGEVYDDAVRLLILTGARKNEAVGAEWREIDFAAKLWTVPASRSKTGEPRRIPLSAPALAMLEERQAVATTRWVFPNPSETAAVQSLQALMRRVQKRSGVTDWTLHDLRRVVRSGLSALGVAREVSEFILGHLPPMLVRVYDRHEPLAEAAAALESWANRVAVYVSAKAEGAEVVPFSREGRG